MTPTHNDLPEDVRGAMAQLLSRRVIDLRDLYLAAKVAHWNVRGPTFAQLHKLFDRVATAVLELTDQLAELALSLGGAVDSQSPRGIVPALPVVAGDNCAAYVDDMAKTLAIVLRAVREDAGEAMAQDDLVTSDLLTQAAATLQRMLLLVERNQ